jgi:hypothetical protein
MRYRVTTAGQSNAAPSAAGTSRRTRAVSVCLKGPGAEGRLHPGGAGVPFDARTDCRGLMPGGITEIADTVAAEL